MRKQKMNKDLNYLIYSKIIDHFDKFQTELVFHVE